MTLLAGAEVLGKRCEEALGEAMDLFQRSPLWDPFLAPLLPIQTLQEANKALSSLLARLKVREKAREKEARKAKK